MAKALHIKTVRVLSDEINRGLNRLLQKLAGPKGQPPLAPHPRPQLA